MLVAIEVGPATFPFRTDLEQSSAASWSAARVSWIISPCLCVRKSEVISYMVFPNRRLVHMHTGCGRNINPCPCIPLMVAIVGGVKRQE